MIIGYKFYKGLPPENYKNELCEWYKNKTGKVLDIDNPKTINEKIKKLNKWSFLSLKSSKIAYSTKFLLRIHKPLVLVGLKTHRELGIFYMRRYSLNFFRFIFVGNTQCMYR